MKLLTIATFLAFLSTFEVNSMYVNAGLYLYKNQPPRGNFFWTLPFYDSEKFDEETRSEGKEGFIRQKEVCIQAFEFGNPYSNNFFNISVEINHELDRIEEQKIKEGHNALNQLLGLLKNLRQNVSALSYFSIVV